MHNKSERHRLKKQIIKKKEKAIFKIKLPCVVKSLLKVIPTSLFGKQVSINNLNFKNLKNILYFQLIHSPS